MRKIILLSISLLVAGVLIPACAPSQGPNNGTAVTNNTVQNPAGEPQGNTKIAASLRRLIQAQKDGAEPFAQQSRFFVMKNGGVLVTITCTVDQINEAANATVKAGGTLASPIGNKLIFDAYVPVHMLEVLAAHGSIAKIERTEQALPPEDVGG